MIEAHVIHSESRLDRKALVENEALQQGFTIKYHPAVFLSTVERGISQAHRNVVQEAKDNGLEWVLIMEDDVKFTAPGAFEYFISQMPEDFDIYLGGVYNVISVNEDKSICEWSGMQCYIVHSRFYDAFLSVNPDKHIDRVMRVPKGKYILCEPMVAIQWETFSDNHKNMLNNSELKPGTSERLYFSGRRFFENKLF